MRAAPAVDAALSDGRTARGALVLLHVAVALVLLAWALAWGQRSWRSLDMGTLLLLATLLLAAALLGFWQARQLLPPMQQRMRWDGQAWQLVQHGQAQALAAVFVQIDLGFASVLRLRAAAPGAADQWALATARAAAADWHGLRIALQHHAAATRAGQDGGLPRVS